MSRHIMIDLETLDTKASAIILSIGAVAFNSDTHEVGVGTAQDTFYTTVSMQSGFDAGLTASGDTLAWWNDQEEQTRAEAFKGKRPLASALHELSSFVFKNAVGTEIPCVWGNDSLFDIGILQNAYAALAVTPPWPFYRARCYRTISHLIHPDFYPWGVGTEHHALHDALYQTNRLLAIARKLHITLE